MTRILRSHSVLSLLLLCIGLSTRATTYPFHATYSGAAEVPPNSSTARGTIVGTYNDVTNVISYSIVFAGLSSNSIAAHFHGPATTTQSAGVQIGHAGFPTGVTQGFYSNSHTLTDAQEAQLLAGLWYSNIHTTMFTGGEIRAQIIMGDPQTTSVFMNRYSGSQEVPPVASNGTGMIVGSYNHETNQISYSIVFSNLNSGTTAAHFHGPATPTQSAGVQIAHDGFPTGVTSGFYSNTNTLSATQEMQFLSNLWYSNIHSQTNRSGEIRANLTPIDILPPVIGNVSVNPSSLWPPNHKMKNVSVNYTSSDNFPAQVTCGLSVASNEPVTSEGDVTSPDWVVVNSNMTQLRAERLGSGNGRIYTITITCTDAQGNSSSTTAMVTVPHDQGHDAITRGGFVVQENAVSGLQLRVLPNPSRNYFNLSIRTENNDEQLQVRLYDIAGRLVEMKNNLIGDQNLQVGKNLRPGVYLLNLVQGDQMRQIRLLKME